MKYKPNLNKIKDTKVVNNEDFNKSVSLMKETISKKVNDFSEMKHKIK